MRATVLAFFVCLACLNGGARAEEARIKSVTINGVAGEELKTAQRAIRARAGDIYSEKTLQDDVLVLLGLAFVENARARQAVSAEGVDVTYDVTAKTVVAGVTFTGNRKFKSGKLLRETGLEGFKHYDIARLAEAREVIIDKYKKAGYLFVKVDFGSQPDGSVLFRIEEGSRLKVAVVNIIGNTAFSDAALKKQVKTKTRRYLVLPYRLAETVVEDDRLRIQEYYRDRGYLDATVGIALNLTANRKGIIIDYTVAEGRLYTVRSIAFSGNVVISSSELEARLKMASGEVFSVSRLEADASAVRFAYGRKGYVDCTVAPSILYAEAEPEVDVTYRIAEGGPIEVGEIEIVGNDRTRDNVIRRDLEFYPGELYDVEKLELSRKNLRRLAYFTKVDISAEETRDGTTPRNATVTVEEASTGSFSVGIGVNSNTGLMGSVVLRQRNFDYRRAPKSFKDVAEGRAWTGGGQTLEFDASPGTELSQFMLRYRDPRVKDSDYSLGLELHIVDRSRHTYSERRSGADVSAGKRFGKNAYWEAGLTADSVRIHGIEADAPPEVRSDDIRGTSQVNVARLTLGHDTRDNMFSPTGGHNLAATIEGSHDGIGSDFDFARVRANGNWYRTLYRDKQERPFVLSWRGRVAQMISAGREDEPIFERLFVGGAYDLRGFEYRGVGPHYGDEALGGKFSATGAVEYEFPLAAEFLRGAIFYDAGTLVARTGDLSAEKVRHSAGFGIRFIIPPPFNMPVALDFGIALKKEKEDQTQVVSFTFGRTF